ncbi:hypothetical protein QQS21_010935 [Conoideocrella luteorostrata]|uniref:Carrier domain-containing protein n=1 Tax=Conoideocrella luteorostrata TaxID=1105319 RepID=A0AAJ0FWC9_9HYPO|nr:hypothetical protein QQS21_010935 [Conoideocrella luteorostrata]
MRDIVEQEKVSSYPFLLSTGSKKAMSTLPMTMPTGARVLPMAGDVERELAKYLPGYMVPKVVIAMRKLPMTATGKLDRRRLREIGGSFSVQQLAERQTERQGPKRQPRTKAERQMQQVWSQLLGINPELINLEDNFFRLGGDSITAMRLVSEMRKHGVELAVADIFRYPTLERTVYHGFDLPQIAPDVPKAFSLLLNPIDVASFVQDVSFSLQLEPSIVVEDAYPCTPLQEGLLSLSMKCPGDYVTQNVLELASELDVEAFRKAWGEVTRKMAILRTRVTQYRSFLVQVVLSEDIRWHEGTDLDEYLEADKRSSMTFDQPLVRCAIIKDSTASCKWFVLTIHHALYDDWSLSLIMDAVYRAYRGQLVDSGPQLSSFINYILEQDNEDATNYWKSALAGYIHNQFPPLPPGVRQSRVEKTIQGEIPVSPRQQSDITVSNLLRAAWALVAGSMTNSQDVVFGMTTSGRAAKVPGVSKMAAPTIATIPVRVKWSKGQNVSRYVETVQNQAAEMIPFEQVGLQKIAKLCHGSQQACQFQTLLIIHTSNPDSLQNDFGRWEDQKSQSSINTYPLMLDLQPGLRSITVLATFDQNVIEESTVQILLERLHFVYVQLAQADHDLDVADVNLVTEQDLQQIWRWNSKVPVRVERCVHELVQEVIQSQPDAPALCAWDGELTYKELDNRATTLAGHLAHFGVEPGVLVPLCFEKSMWTAVATLGVLMAGGGFVLLDPSLPEQRLAAIVRQIEPKLILSSSVNVALSSRLSQKVLVLSSDLFQGQTVASSKIIRQPSPTDVMYVVFTSGSTGTPKGVKISHQNMASALHHQMTPLGFNPSARYFDFTSYSFDTAISNIFATLASGGCLCVPSDQNRKTNLAASMKSFRANLVELIPTVARTLAPQEMSGLQSIMFGGEDVVLHDVERWWDTTKVINTYGPSECTPTSTINISSLSPRQATGIGYGAGAVTWIVDPENHHHLLPVGCIGELLLEGPIVGLGYLDNNEKTAAAFIKDPKWLQQGAPGQEGRRGRLYKTGDLVRYRGDGSLSFLGRKDDQVKIRGQRIELSEIETHIQKALASKSGFQAVALVLTPRDCADPILVAFISGPSHSQSAGLAAASHEDLLQVTQGVEDMLYTNLPSYMVPSVFLETEIIPTTSTGKTDRRTLCTQAACMTKEELASKHILRDRKYCKPESTAEKQLQKLWSSVLGIDSSSISADDSFLRIGGDSIQSMRLAGAARELGLLLTVADIFKYPKLRDLARVLSVHESESIKQEPFSLLGSGIDRTTARSDIAKLCCESADRVLDAFPCTPLQEGLLAMSHKNPGAYIYHNEYLLPSHVDISRFKKACETVVAETSILRTRIVDLAHSGLVQVVIDEAIDWDGHLGDEPDSMLMGLGTRLALFGMTTSTDTGRLVFRLVLHHALYDGWSFPMMLDAIEDAYKGGRQNLESVPFSSFVRHLVATDKDKSSNYWRSYLEGYEGASFPVLPTLNYSPQADGSIQHTISNIEWPSLDITAATVIRTGWSLLQGSRTGRDDVIYGATVTGRQAAVPGIDRIIGPTIATVPVRTILDWDATVGDLFSRLQLQALESTAFEQAGLQNIRKLSEDAEMACSFQTLLVIQPIESDEGHDQPQKLFQNRRNTQGHNDPAIFNTYGMTVACDFSNCDVQVYLSYDTNVVSYAEAHQLLRGLEHILHQLCKPGVELKQLKDVTTVTEQDLCQLWERNSTVPQPVHAFVHDLIAETVQNRLQAPAVCAWDDDLVYSQLTYGELDRLSTHLACQLSRLAVGPGDIIPLFFGRSIWTSVAMLGVMKTGAASVVLDTAQPLERLQAIVQQVSPTTILASTLGEAIAVQLRDSAKVIVVSQDYFASSHGDTHTSLPQSTGTPSDPLYIVFTSGTTGIPKGVVVSHASFSSASVYQRQALGYTVDDRVLDFASPAFDLFWSNYLNTFITGCCLCTPTDSQRKDNLAGFIADQKITFAHLTPSTARLLRSNLAPTMTTLVLGGELVPREDFDSLGSLVDIKITYGPSECSPTSTIMDTTKLDWATGDIGEPVGLCAWVVHPVTHRLVPAGSIGELWLEGPLVASGYINNTKMTASAFVEDPPWLLQGGPGVPGRRGRVYRTGDLVRYNNNGMIHFIGRKDNQVKVRGQRVELGEVEAHMKQVLAHMPAVQVVVEVVTMRNSANPILVAFVSLPGFEGNVSDTKGAQDALKAAVSAMVEGMDQQLANRVPAYMIPSAYFPISSLPVTATGKLDRRKLRNFAATLNLAESTTYEKKRIAPSNKTETLLATVWAQTLNISYDSISIDLPFTKMGGDSISAMQVVSRSRMNGLQLTVSDILRHLTIEKIAPYSRLLHPNITQHNGRVEEDEQQWQLSPIQNMFFLAHPLGLNHFNQSFAFRLKATVPAAQLQIAAETTVSRHAMLRARFRRDTQGKWQQYTIGYAENAFSFKTHRLETEEQACFIMRERQKTLDIEAGPVFAIDYLKVGDDTSDNNANTFVLFTAHHLVIDLVSWRILWYEIEQVMKRAPVPPTTSTSFRSWVCTQELQSRVEDQRQLLPFELVTEFDTWGVASSDNTQSMASDIHICLDTSTTSLLLGKSNDCMQTDPVDIMVAILSLSFYQYFPERRAPAIFIEGHGREPSDDTVIDLSATVGWFTTICPVQAPLRQDSTLFDAVKFVKDARRRTPGKGLPYCNRRYGTAYQAKHEPVEFLFNYAGIYQHLESEESLFSPLEIDLMESSPDTCRTALVEMNSDVTLGKFHLSISMHNHMKHRDRLEQWAHSLDKQFKIALHTLANAGAMATLVDYPLLAVSYEALQSIMTHLGSMGLPLDSVADIFPCTPLQEGIHLSTAKNPTSYRIVNIWKCLGSSGTGQVDIDRLENAWRLAVARHSVFRILCVEAAGYKGFLQVQLRHSPANILRKFSGQECPEKYLRNLEWPLLRRNEPEYAITTCAGATGEVACRVDISHALIDATSFAILLADVKKAYSDKLSKQSAPSLSQVVGQIMKIPALEKLEYWKNYLLGVEPCRLPSTLLPTEVRDEFQQGYCHIPSFATDRLHLFCQTRNLTCSTVLHVAWAVVLSQLTGKQDVCFGYLASGRDVSIEGVEDVVGPLVNLLIGRVNVGLPLSEALESAKRDSIDHFAFQHVSLAELQQEMGLQGEQLFTTAITIRQDLDENDDVPGECLSFESADGEDPHEFDIVLGVVMDGPSTEVVLNYNMRKISQSLADEAADILEAAITYLTDTNNESLEEPLHRVFFQYAAGVAETVASSIWKEWMQGLETIHFPTLPHPGYRSQAHAREDYEISDISIGQDKISTTATLWAGWAILLSTYANTSDAVFGSITSSSTAESGVQNRNPLSIMPVRIKVDQDQSIGDMLDGVAAICNKMTHFRRISPHWLRRISDEGEQMCSFQSSLDVRVAPCEALSEKYPETAGSPPLRLACTVAEASVHLTVQFDDQVLDRIQVQRAIRQFEAIIRQLCNPRAHMAAIQSIDVTSEQDMRQIWQWNATVPHTAQICVHDIIAETVKLQPQSQAICAWDGDLTFAELDVLSTQLAVYLTQTLSVGPGSIISLCFEKSMWMPVAMLGVMKAGGASVAMDTTQPVERLREIVRQATSTIILSSTANEMLAHSLVDSHKPESVVVLAERVLQKDHSVECQAPVTAVTPQDTLYVVFTSGSTGTPKGIAISHANFSSAILHQKDYLCYRPSSRVFDFASYAFDVAWFNVLFTLRVGGCLCIPSEKDRRDNISGAIRRLKANYAELTATVGRLIKPSEVPCLQTIQFCGERLTLPVLDQWSHIQELFQCYGPAECTAATTINRITEVGNQNPHVGKGYGTVTWVVSTQRDGLAFVGEVGELWVEGPLVAQGYLNDPSRTSMSFVEDPTWLLQGGPGVPGRHGRLYRTGDLVRCDNEGNLHFVGRKDDQVKIRGQRIELGEIEAHIKRTMPSVAPDLQIVVDVATLQGNVDPTLVAFIHLSSHAEDGPHGVEELGDGQDRSQCLSAAASQLVQGLDEKLASIIPSYMIPSACLVIESMPTTATGKTDRKTLRAMVGRLTQEELARKNVMRSLRRRVPATAFEIKLQGLWSDVLNLDATLISLDDSFLQIGGDSIQAMRLAGAARDQGLMLTVAEIFKHPKLDDLAQLLSQSAPTALAITGPKPFALLGDAIDRKTACTKVAALCGVEASQVCDIFPCTPLQEGLLAMTARKSNNYILHNEFVLKQGIDGARFQEACRKAVDLMPILRTRIVNLPGQGLVQVVVNEEMAWCSQSISTQEIEMGLGTKLAMYGLVPSVDSGRPIFHLVLHHALFDGWSFPLMLDVIRDIYMGSQPQKSVPFSSFVEHIVAIDTNVSAEHWRLYLDGNTAVTFPALPSPDYTPHVNGSLEHMIDTIEWPRSDITASTFAYTAWALVQSIHTATDDVIFGGIVTGRQAVPGVDRIIGPTIATIPVRIAIDWQATIGGLLRKVQQQALEAAPFEQTGVQNIRKASADAAAACGFQTLLVLQPIQPRNSPESFFVHNDDMGSDEGTFDTYALVAELILETNGLHLSLKYDTSIVTSAYIKEFVSQFENILRQLCTAHLDTLTLRDIEIATKECIGEIWKWNAVVPKPIDACVHELITKTAQKQPQAVAISSWDGELMYNELEGLSTRLAYQLVKQGVRPGHIVPLYLEKSKWLLVAMLGVMKAGGASVVMDYTGIPLERLREIAQQISTTTVILSSVAGEAIAKQLHSSASITVVRKDSFGTALASDTDTLAFEANVQPCDLLYVVFTSGSTGKPKAVMISHRNFSTASYYQGERLGFNNLERVLDFSSSAFDVFWSTCLHSLISGACLCIPTESQRKDDLSGFMTEQKVSLADLTPSTAKVIRSRPPKYLKTLILGGELVSCEEFESLISSTNVKITYGPAECTPTSSILDTTTSGNFKTADIGHTWGLCAWVVHPSNLNLVPRGRVGELWLEGPLVGMNYLNDHEKSATAFVEDPPWLVRGMSGTSTGRRGRVYRTGDLVRYNEDGSLHFIGRKDDQVKIRGQRVELGEVQMHIKQALLKKVPDIEVLADVVTPRSSTTPILVCFLSLQTNNSHHEDYDSSEKSRLSSSRATITQSLQGLHDKLAVVAPAYMIPSIYLEVAQIPMTTTGKTDRRGLLNITSRLSLEELNSQNLLHHRKYREPASPQERMMRQLWADILEIDAASISADDSFLQIGGDSIQAMRLTGLAREHGFMLSVAAIFRHPKLYELAETKIVVDGIQTAMETPEPFSLLSKETDKDEACLQASTLCGVDAETIEDILPCVPLQEGLLAMTAKGSGNYIAYNEYSLTKHVDVERFKNACQAVVKALPILRTRIIDLPGQGLVQVIIAEDIQWNATHHSVQMGLGTPLVLFNLSISESDQPIFQWTLHHTVYDGWTFPMMLQAIDDAYLGISGPTFAPFSNYVRYIQHTDSKASAHFWRTSLQNVNAPVFPPLPSSDYIVEADGVLEEMISVQWPQSNITPSTIVRTCWALLQAIYAANDDVVFGSTVTGRQAAIPGIERMAGPTIATVPVRVRIDWQATVGELLHQVQQQALDTARFEQVGLQNIRKMGPDAEMACNFQALLVVQPVQPSDSAKEGGLFETSIQAQAQQHADNSSTYALTALCDLGKDHLNLMLKYDSTLLSHLQAERYMKQLRHLVGQLCRIGAESIILKDMPTMTQADLHQIWEWNEAVPPPIHTCVHELIAGATRRQPQASAICAWDGELTYHKLDELSTKLAHCLSNSGVRPGVIVPLCFEKSMWMPVAVLGVMKAGGASVALDPTLPPSRLRDIVRQAQEYSSLPCHLILTSSLLEEQSKSLMPHDRQRHAVMTIPKLILSKLESSPQPHIPTSGVTPEDILYVVFTSGSTGQPKGVVVTHSNFSSAIIHQRSSIGMQQSTRVFDFASYAFDAAWANILHTLAAGACICIPSDEDRRSRITGAIQDLQVNYADLTPAVARLIRPRDVPSLQKIKLVGEMLSKSTVDQWRHIEMVVNAYGPAECSILSTLNHVNEDYSSHPSIGKGCGTVTWVVSLQRCGLASIGEVGELWVEGPLVAKGYLNNPELTEAKFIKDPSWLLQGTSGTSSGRSGRLYKTGDLVRYNHDGTLQFMGRKDDQIKIRGQRVELGEVEVRVRQTVMSKSEVQVITEMVTPQNCTQTVFVAFIYLQDSYEQKGGEQDNARQNNDDVQDSRQEGLRLALDHDIRIAEEKLSAALPSYMVPSVFLAVETIPMTATGKIDRRMLRHQASRMTRETLALHNIVHRSKFRHPSTMAAKQLQQLWAEVLNTEPTSISADDSFIKAGGDSIQAMRLVGAARERGWFSLTVADTLGPHSLDHLAKMLTVKPSFKTLEPVKQFSLLPAGMSVDKILAPTIAKHTASFSRQDISDVFPVTDIQSAYINAATERPPRSCSVFYLTLPYQISNEAVARMCDFAWNQFDALRTAFVESDGRYWHVITSTAMSSQLSVHELQDDAEESLHQLYRDALQPSLQLGSAYTQFLLSRSPGKLRLGIRMSHAQYDGISFGELLSVVSAHLAGRACSDPRPQFSHYIKYALSRENEAMDYWRNVLQGSQPLYWFPRTHSQPLSVKTDSPTPARPLKIKKLIKAPQIPSGVTSATHFISACASALSKVTESTDVVFGFVVSGRSTLQPSLSAVFGPCVNVIPIRASIKPEMGLGELSLELQQQRMRGVRFETSTCADLLDQCTDWPKDMRYHRCIVTFQDIEEQPTLDVADGDTTELHAFPEDVIDDAEVLYIYVKPNGTHWDLQVSGGARDHELHLRKDIIERIHGDICLLLKHI